MVTNVQYHTVKKKTGFEEHSGVKNLECVEKSSAMLLWKPLILSCTHYILRVSFFPTTAQKYNVHPFFNSVDLMMQRNP